MSSAEACTW